MAFARSLQPTPHPLELLGQLEATHHRASRKQLSKCKRRARAFSRGARALTLAEGLAYLGVVILLLISFASHSRTVAWEAATTLALAVALRLAATAAHRREERLTTRLRAQLTALAK